MAAACIWVAGAASYLVLAGSFSPDELAAAALLGALAVAWRAALMREGARRFRFERPTLRVVGAALLGWPGAVLRVGVRLARALLHPVAGRRVERAFHRGGADDDRDRARRAAVVLAASFAPDAYVLRLPLDEAVMRFHSLSGAAPGGDPRWPA